MKNLNEARQAIKKKIDEARALHEGAKKEERVLNADEQKRYDELMGEIDSMKAEVEREQRLQDLEAGAPTAQEPGPNEFREFGDFIQTVRFNPGDPRLQFRERPQDSEKRVLSMGVGAAGGFLIPQQFSDTIRMVDAQSAVIRPGRRSFRPEIPRTRQSRCLP